MQLDNEIVDSGKQELVDMLFSDNTIKKYILGRNESAKKLSKVIEFDAFIDDFTDEISYLGERILKTKDIETDSIVISCSLAIYPFSAMESVKKHGVEKILTYLDVMKYSSNNLLAMDFIDNAYSDLKNNLGKYKDIYIRMMDEESKKVFSDILNFRKNKDLHHMEGYSVDFVGQYFEGFLNLKPGEVFIDAGGYDGQTSIEFIKHCPEYKSIYIFEPSAENLVLAEKNLKNYKNIQFLTKGLSDKKEVLSFDPVAGSASSISQHGTVKIHVDTMDALVTEKVSFIKMDIEGAESLAIDGMKNHILNDYPKLAISVYHKPDDFWRIPEQILAIRDDYDLYMRHYIEGTDETVMFFMPRA